MNAQHLAALGIMVREAITEHCKALGGVFAQQLSERDQQIESLTSQLQQLQNTQTPRYDDTEVRRMIDTQGKQLALLTDPDVQDDTSYDDIWWKLEDRVKAMIPAPYDDEAIKSAFSEQGKRVATVVDGVQAIKDRIEDVAKSVPAAYDDSGLRAEVFMVRKNHISDMEALLVRIKELADRPMPTPADGRDALQLEVLPAIDEQKSYTRGTYAKHAGGLWRAFEQTSGLRGWECIVNGVKSVDARWEGKTLIETTTLSDGTTHETRKSFAVQEYKGVFAHGEHEQGDTVTWAGSLWHCNVTGTKALPGDGSADWTLAVKKGRDGREVVKTERAQWPVKITDQLARG